MSTVMGVRVSLDQIINSDAPNAANRDRVVPHKATILSGNSGTLVELENGALYLVPVGEWFRSPFYGRSIPQVTEFNKLQDYGLTSIKDKLVRKEDKKQPQSTMVKHGEEVRSKNNVSIKKIDKAMASDNGSKKEN